MTTALETFLLSFILSLVLTPAVAYLALRLRILDRPAARKVHRTAIPRAGGIAIYLASTLSFVAVVGAHTWILQTVDFDGRVLGFLAGGALVFALGLWDDFRPLGVRFKLTVQVAAAVIAYAGGAQILKVGLAGLGEWSLGWLSLPVSVLWFLLIINGMNLIDGLDGLAAGIALFAALILLAVWQSPGSFVVAIGLASLAGTSLGFLRYNFYPASIFLGDGGAYFLGYSLAALSTLGSIKSEATVAMLVPIIALGVPVMDAVWAPCRRFLLGRQMFRPDMDHIHHRLLKLGYTQRRVVLMLYGVTVLMGLISLVLVHSKDEHAALILFFVGAIAIVSIRQLGYLDFINRRGFVGWVVALGDQLGLRRSRRSFLESQISISQAETVNELWERIGAATESLGIDYCALTLTDVPVNENGRVLSHRHNGPIDVTNLDQSGTLFMAMPLFHQQEQIGLLTVAKRMGSEANDRYIFRRIDQLQGTVEETLVSLREQTLIARRAEAPATANANGVSQGWVRDLENPIS